MRSVGMSTHPQRRKAAGFSLIEVLIAILILAVGLLGFALMQTTTLRYTQSSDYRTRATNLAYELLDQMRVNRLSAADYVAAGFAAKTVSGTSCPRAVGSQIPITGEDGFIERWQCQVVQTLGEDASATVEYNPASGLATVVLSWEDRIEEARVGDDPSTSFSVETHL